MKESKLMYSNNVPDVYLEEIERLRDQLIILVTKHNPEVAFNALSIAQAFLFANACNQDYDKMKILVDAHVQGLYLNIKEFSKNHEASSN